MHRMVLVIGDVEPQMNALLEQGWCDWWAPGGRYTGTLPLRPGATGKAFGDAVPPFEQALAAMMPNDVTLTRGSGDMTGDGVDQAHVGDVDRVAVTTSALVQDGRVIADSEEIISSESNAVMMTFGLARLYLDRGMDPPFPPPADADLRRAEREEAQWRMTVLDHLRALPHDAMLTVVDVHS